MNYRPHEHGCGHSTQSNAAYAVEENERQAAGYEHVGNVETKLYVAEVALNLTCYHADKKLAGHHRHVGLHLEGYAHGKDYAACQRAGRLGDVAHRLEPRERRHGYVDESAEAKRYGYLQQVHPKVGTELGARHQEELEHEERQVDYDCPLPHR